jgi:signal transduction histidine kinase
VEPEIRRKDLALRWWSEGYDEIPVSPSVVRQVLLNLLLNACQATPTGGEVSFEATVDGSRFIATVEDTGPGLSGFAQDVLVGRTDDAYSATGSGLGLWMVRRLVKEVGGAVSVRPRMPEGTVIRVIIPFVSEEGLADVA